MEGEAGGPSGKVEEVGHHERQDEQGDEAAFVADLAQPFGLDHQAPNGKTDDRRGDGDGESGGEESVGGTEPAGMEIEKREAGAEGEVIQRHQAEGAEPPKEKGVREAGERAL